MKWPPPVWGSVLHSLANITQNIAELLYLCRNLFPYSHAVSYRRLAYCKFIYRELIFLLFTVAIAYIRRRKSTSGYAWSTIALRGWRSIRVYASHLQLDVPTETMHTHSQTHTQTHIKCLLLVKQSKMPRKWPEVERVTGNRKL